MLNFRFRFRLRLFDHHRSVGRRDRAPLPHGEHLQSKIAITFQRNSTHYFEISTSIHKSELFFKQLLLPRWSTTVSHARRNGDPLSKTFTSSFIPALNRRNSSTPNESNLTLSGFELSISPAVECPEQVVGVVLGKRLGVHVLGDFLDRLGRGARPLWEWRIRIL